MYIYLLNNIILIQASRMYMPRGISYLDHMGMVVYILNMTVSINKILYKIII